MKPHDLPHGLCSIDPVSLLTIGAGILGGVGGGLLGKDKGASQTSTATTPTPPPKQEAAIPPTQDVVGTKPKPKPQTPTFLGQSVVPPQGSGGKTLLGQ